MGKKKAKNKKNTELKIIFFIILVAAALFIVSTYAWFSTQRNVSITNLAGKVEVAEGLEISLDAENWSNGIILGDGEGEKSIIKDAYTGHRNISPVEMLPVSTMGVVTENMSDIQMLRGKVTNSKTLTEIVAMDETLALSADPEDHVSENTKYPGYFAFDIFLKNSSKENKADVLQLNYDSSLEILEGDTTEVTEARTATGLQNTARVAFARYGSTEIMGQDGKGTGVWSGVAGVNDEPNDILTTTGAPVDGAQTVYITDVAMWEPNANDHVAYIVKNNNKITWSSTDASKYNVYEYDDDKMGFGTTTQMPTYALTASALGDTLFDLYDWDGKTDKAVLPNMTKGAEHQTKILDKQMVIQTTKTSATDYTIKEGVQNLVSTASTATKGTGAINFTIAPNSVIRLRVYVWLEGQDVDCINYASHGGGITLNIGLVKGSDVDSHEPSTTPSTSAT